MTQVNVQQAKTHLSRLLARVEQGEEIVIARDGRPIARIEPIETPSERQLGFTPFELPETFFEPLPESELAAWES